MEDKNFQIIEDVFENNYSDKTELNNIKKNLMRTPDSHSARPPYPVSNLSQIPSLSYDEDIIRDKLNRHVNPRQIVNQEYNSMNNSNRILQYPNLNLRENTSNERVPLRGNTSNEVIQNKILNCRSVYEHIEDCPICNKYYKQSNRIYIFIIFILVIVLLILLRERN